MTDPTFTVHVGDARQVLATLEPASVDLVLTSPPFLALRSYLPPDDPAKPLEMGSEPTPGEFIDGLLDVVEACDRVLAPHGSICIELGDTYSGSGGAGGDYGTKDPGAKALREGQPKFSGSALAGRRTRNANRPSGEGRGRLKDEPGGDQDGWPLDKSLCLIPEIFRFSLVYGFNPLTGRGTPRWRARNVVRWVRPNPPVGALADKFRPATSELVVACKGRSRYFDLDAVRSGAPSAPGGSTNWHPHDGRDKRGSDELSGQPNTGSHPAGAPPLDWWCISPGGYPGSHYAVYPPELLVRPIKAMSPERVCTTCGKPSERIAETTNAVGHAVGQRSWLAGANGHAREIPDRNTAAPDVAERVTLGWTDCGHDTWRAGVVLDPFLGSGTTTAVAHGHGRSCVGIDLDRRNLDLIADRMGMWAPDVIDHLGTGGDRRSAG